MPHIREVESTSHDRHDPMLVAALAAGDLAAIDRDKAIALTRRCADCAALHDDLLALATATASAPPPYATRPRDFRLAPADAARLRPRGWRRFVAAVSGTPSALSRPMGVGLATLGLVGLLVGNIQFGAVSSATVPQVGGAGTAESAGGPPPDADMLLVPSAGGAVPGAAAAAAASGGPVTASGPENAGPIASTASRSVVGPDGKSAGGAPVTAEPQAARDAVATPETARPLNFLFGAAVVLGIAILVAGRVRSRRAA